MKRIVFPGRATTAVTNASGAIPSVAGENAVAAVTRAVVRTG